MYRVRDFAEERSRTLYVRLPHTIRDPNEVQELFNEDAKVKLPRQSSRACHVIFSSIEEKIKGLKGIKKKKVDGKRIVAFSPKTKPMENKKSRKKLVVPIPKPELQISKSVHVSNIKNQTTIDELKAAFPGCTSVSMLHANENGLRSALMTMESFEAASALLHPESKTPVVLGNRLVVRSDSRSSKKSKREPRTNEQKPQVHDEDSTPSDKKLRKRKKGKKGKAGLQNEDQEEEKEAAE